MANVKLLSTVSTCLANFGAQYNFQTIAVALLTMSTSECTSTDERCRDGHQEPWVTGTANAVVFIGAVVGQLSMGVLGDYISRNGALSITLLIATIAAFLSAVAPAGDPNSVYATIVVFRFFVGVGLGGIYPIAATKASEDTASTDQKTNASGSAFAFFWQIPGLIAPWLLAWILTYSVMTADARWRLLLGLGSVPLALSIACLLFESHLKKEPLVCRRRHSSLAAQDDAPSHSTEQVDIWLHLQKAQNWNKLIATGGSWFLYDVIFYGLSLIGGTVIHAIHTASDDDVSSNASMRSLCSKQTLALALGMLPMALNLYLLPRLSLKYLQIAGFVVQTFFLFLFVCLFSHLKANDVSGLFALYCLVSMSLQFGVPVTTYTLPAAVFEKDIRCTFNGIASAMGKGGAILGAYTFYYIALLSIHAVLIICAVTGFCGAFVTLYYLLDSSLVNDDVSAKLTHSGSSLNFNTNFNKDDFMDFLDESTGTVDSHGGHLADKDDNAGAEMTEIVFSPLQV